MNASPDGSARKRRLASAVAFALVLALLGTNLYTFSFFWYRELDRANADYQRRRLQIEDAPVRAVDVVFAGDSFIEEGFWSQWYPDVAIANVGARGTTAHAMYYRRHHITRAQPAKVFVMVGINDLNISGLRLGTDRLKQMYALLLQDMADSMPRARVHVHAILPTGEAWPRDFGVDVVGPLNAFLKQEADRHGFAFVDLVPALANARGRLDERYTSDGLHLNAAGYAVWRSHIDRYLK